VREKGSVPIKRKRVTLHRSESRRAEKELAFFSEKVEGRRKYGSP